MNAMVSRTGRRPLDLQGRRAPGATWPARMQSEHREILFTDKPQALLDLVASEAWNELLGFHQTSQERAVTRVTPVRSRPGTSPRQWPVAAAATAMSTRRAPWGTASHWHVEFSHSPRLRRQRLHRVSKLEPCEHSGRGRRQRSYWSQHRPDRRLHRSHLPGAVQVARHLRRFSTLLDMSTARSRDVSLPRLARRTSATRRRSGYRRNNALKLWMQKSLVAERIARGPADSPKP